MLPAAKVALIVCIVVVVIVAIVTTSVLVVKKKKHTAATERLVETTSTSEKHNDEGAYDRNWKNMTDRDAGKFIIHIMYIPWDKEGKLKPDQHDFDHAAFEKTVAQAPACVVLMWTHDLLRDFSNSVAPGLWDLLWKTVQHPVQIVDFYRWFVVYYFGGLYWQYQSTNHVPFEKFASPTKPVRLFTEMIFTDEECKQKGKMFAIRAGKPEEPLRVMTQVFWAKPYQPFVKHMCDVSLQRLSKYRVKEDYDILFIGSNALVSELYDTWPGDDIELISLPDAQKMVTVSSNHSWHKRAW